LFLFGPLTPYLQHWELFTFNDAQLGNTLLESDGGTFRNSNWLNIVNANPGNPGALTGANFDTASPISVWAVRLSTLSVTIQPLRTGLVRTLESFSARFSVSDTFNLAVSTDGIKLYSVHGFRARARRDHRWSRGITFMPAMAHSPLLSSLHRWTSTYFGLAAGATISAVRISALPEGDLIRVAGINAIPEPSSILLISSGMISLAFFIGDGNSVRDKSQDETRYPARLPLLDVADQCNNPDRASGIGILGQTRLPLDFRLPCCRTI